jgi:protein SCO1/2
VSTVLDRPVDTPGRSRGPWESGRVAAVCALLALLVAAVLVARPAWLSRDGGAFKGDELRPAVTLPALSLARMDGRRFTTADTYGRQALFFFGYTRCPDVCPLTLAQMMQIQRQLGAEAGQLDIYFVTVDPARDTPERLRAYLANFGPRVVGLIGTTEELAATLRAFGAVAERRQSASWAGDYAMDHTALTYLVDPAGRIRLIYPYPIAPEDAVADLRRLIAAEPNQGILPIRAARPASMMRAAGDTGAIPSQ